MAKVSPDLTKPYELGTQISVLPNYIEAAIDRFEKIFTLIAAEFWKKTAADDEDRGSVLVATAFGCLVDERWEVAKGLSAFLMRDKALPERDQLIGQINYWQASKWSGRFEDVRLEIERADFSAKDPIFQLARYALLDRFDDFFRILPPLVASGAISSEALSTWPLFRQVREDERFSAFLRAGEHTQTTDQGAIRSESPDGARVRDLPSGEADVSAESVPANKS